MNLGRTASRIECRVFEIDLPEWVDTVSRYAVTTGHEYTSGRVFASPDFLRRSERFTVRCVTVGFVVRNYPLTVTCMHRVTQSQEHIHSRRSNFIAVPVAGKRPY